MSRQAVLFGISCLTLGGAIFFAIWLVASDSSTSAVASIPAANTQSQPPEPTGATPRPARPEVKGAAVGDSVLLAAAPVLSKDFPAIDVDAVVGRGVPDGIAALRKQAAAGKLGDLVLVHLGNNGEFTDAQFEEIAAIAGPQRRLVFLTVRVPREWEAPNNEVITRGVQRHPNAILVDWFGASKGRPELLWDDGVHLRPAGVDVYAALVERSLAP